jgi:hypothetical protein
MMLACSLMSFGILSRESSETCGFVWRDPLAFEHCWPGGRSNRIVYNGCLGRGSMLQVERLHAKRTSRAGSINGLRAL